MDYAILPPEVNSARMYAGPGPGSLSGAATAWQGLAAELHSAANSYSVALSALAVDWQGPSAARMTAAAVPYVTWLRDAAWRAEETAAQARAAVDSYETAFAATVPPPAVAANRSRLAALVATNTLGQNTQAITLAEMQYAQMWAEDAAAMYQYAAASSAATQLTPFTAAPWITNPTGGAAEDTVAAHAAVESAGGAQALLSQLTALTGTTATPVQAIPPGLDSLLGILSPSSPLSLATEALGAFLRGFSVGSTSLVNIIFGMNLSMLWMQAAMSPVGMTAAVAPELAAATAQLGSGAGAAVSATVGGARLAGTLSVPTGWITAAPTAKLVTGALHSTAAASAATITGDGTGRVLSQMPLAGLVGGALGRARVPAVNVLPVDRADMTSTKSDSKPSKFDRVLAELSQNPETVQHWHTDKAQLESLLERLSKQPGTHAVHVHPGAGKKSSAAPEPGTT